MYGDYCFWSWFRYWYLDSVNYVTLLLLDKGYYDYDHVQPEEKKRIVTYEESVKSDEEVCNLLAGFGLKQFANKKPKTIDEIQKHIIEQESYGS